MTSKVLTVKEVATYLHCHQTTIYRLIKQNRIPVFRIGGSWRFNIEGLDAWRQEQIARLEQDPFPSRGRRE